MLPEGNVFDGAHRHGMPVNLQLIAAAGPAQHRVLVPGVRRDPLAGGDFEHRAPHGYEKVRLVALAELVVHTLQGLRRVFSVLQAGLDQHPGNHHQQRGGHALTGYVRHDKGYVVVVDHKEIVKVAAHFLGRRHAGEEAELFSIREGREESGQLAGLDPAGHVQLRSDPLFFRGDFFDLVYVQAGSGGLFGKAFRENLDFVSGSVHLFHLELSVSNAQGRHAPGYRIQRAGDPACDGERGGKPRCHDQHHQKDQDVPGVEHLLVKGVKRIVANAFVLILQPVFEIDLLLRLVGFLHQLFHFIRLIKEHRRINRDHQNDGDQQHAEYLRSDTACEESSQFFHSCLPW